MNYISQKSSFYFLDITYISYVKKQDNYLLAYGIVRNENRIRSERVDTLILFAFCISRKMRKMQIA